MRQSHIYEIIIINIVVITKKIVSLTIIYSDMNSLYDYSYK